MAAENTPERFSDGLVKWLSLKNLVRILLTAWMEPANPIGHASYLMHELRREPDDAARYFSKNRTHCTNPSRARAYDISMPALGSSNASRCGGPSAGLLLNISRKMRFR